MTFVKARCAGTATPLIDGVEKVTGRAAFTADLPSREALVGRILRSPLAHGVIQAIDTARAKALPGVRAVITGADCDVPYGVLPIAQNEYPLARERVRYVGEPIAAVAAVDEATAQAALDLILAAIDPLPAYFTAQDALAEGATRLHENKQGNIEREVRQEFGDVEAASGAGPARGIITTPVTHARLGARSPSTMPSDRLTLHSPTQVPCTYLMLAVREDGRAPIAWSSLCRRRLRHAPKRSTLN
jgi:4-hydroxybenzoyl-CoA reductase subunit alpha